jgi:hypothetical protein
MTQAIQPGRFTFVKMLTGTTETRFWHFCSSPGCLGSFFALRQIRSRNPRTVR